MADAKTVWALLAGMMLIATPAAHAQATTPATEKFFVSLNLGGQLTTGSIGISSTQRIYDETATLTSTQKVGRGPLFDVGGGYRVWGDVFVGVIATWYSNTAEATWEASVPDPLFFNRPKKSTGSTTGLKRTEQGTFVHMGWAFPLTDRLDMTAAAGVAFIKVKQDLVNSFSVPNGTQTVTTGKSAEDASATGLFAQVDVIYNLMQHVGAGGYVRYAGGKADLPSLQSHKVGGAQVGGGLRLRF